MERLGLTLDRLKPGLYVIDAVEDETTLTFDGSFDGEASSS